LAEKNDGTRIPLLAWNEKGKLTPMLADEEWKPGEGWTIASLYLANPASKE
jgi:hypothetical protein